MTFKGITYTIVILASLGVLYYIADSIVSTGALSNTDLTIQDVQDDTDEESKKSINQLLDQALNDASTSTDSILIKAPKAEINAMVADTSTELANGLSGKESLAETDGMLFVFEVPGKYGFWMKDMQFPIDIIWIDGSKTVLGVTSDVASSTYPNLFLPPADNSYVLELNSGAAMRFGIATGTVLTF